MLGDALIAFGVDHRDLCASIRQPILDLSASPPRIERRDDRAAQRSREKCDWPLGQIAHHDRDAIALHDALLLQLVRKCEHGPREGVERRPLVLVHKKRTVPETAADLEHMPQCRRAVLPRFRGYAANDQLFDLVTCAWRCEARVRRLDRHRRPVGRKRRHRRDCLSRGALRHAHLAREPHNAAAHCRGRDSNRQSALTMLKQGRWALGAGLWPEFRKT